MSELPDAPATLPRREQGASLTRIFIAISTVFTLTTCQPAQPEAEVLPADVATPIESNSEFLDPVVVDAAHYALELENDYVRVLREKLPANVQGAMHSHRDRVSIYLNPAEVVITPLEGEPVTVNLEASSIAWGKATTHSRRADAELENISVELQDWHGDIIEVPETDATKTDPEHHVVEFENDRVRVLRIIYPAGYKTPVHTHLPSLIFSVNDYELKDMDVGAEPRVMKIRGGSAIWSEGGTEHASENQGDGDAVVLRVEMKQKP